VAYNPAEIGCSESMQVAQRARRPGGAPGIRPQAPQEAPPEAARLDARLDEQEREEPGRLSLDGDPEGDGRALAAGHDPAVAPWPEGQLAEQRAQAVSVVARQRRLVPAGVELVAGGVEDLEAGRQIGPFERPLEEAAHGFVPTCSVASRSSSAAMNVSRSPSRTAPVLLVSTSVRWSLTIWYGCST